MNNKIIVFLFLLLGSFYSSSLTAQSNLSFGTSGVQHEDTLNIGDSIHFSFWLVNQGAVNINDSISMSCETFDIIGTSISSMPIGNNYNTVGSLSVGDSIFVTITEVVSYSSYVLGDNIIVIWPAFIGSGGVDTSMTPIHILGNTSSSELEMLNNKLIVFPNPIKDYFTLSNQLGLPISGITLSDALGNILYVDKSIYYSSCSFNLSRFQSGTYFIETIINNQRITKRIVLVK